MPTDLKPITQRLEDIPAYLVQNFRRLTRFASDISSLSDRVGALETSVADIETDIIALQARGFVSQYKWGSL